MCNDTFFALNGERFLCVLDGGTWEDGGVCLLFSDFQIMEEMLVYLKKN